MGNRITAGADWVKMSNGLSTVVLDVLSLSGRALAQTESEDRLVKWLADRGELMAMGIGGFDMTELPWAAETFDHDRNFLDTVFRDAAGGERWAKLDYEPSADRLVGTIARLRSFLAAVPPP